MVKGFMSILQFGSREHVFWLVSFRLHAKGMNVVEPEFLPVVYCGHYGRRQS